MRQRFEHLIKYFLVDVAHVRRAVHRFMFRRFLYELAVLGIKSGDIYIPLSLCYYVFSNGLIAVFLVVTARLLSLFKREGCTRRQRRNFLSITSVIDFLISTSIRKSRFRTRLSLWGGIRRKKRANEFEAFLTRFTNL